MSNILEVARLECHYLVPADMPAPEQLRWRLDRVAQNVLPEVLASATSSLFQAADSGVWFIRRLDTAFEIRSDCAAEDQVAKTWAAQTTRILAERTTAPGGDPNVLYFKDRAAYLAQFLTDVAQGDAWSKWYYESFSGLRLLSAADALATALCRDRELSLNALSCISDAALRRILASLLSQHADRVWRHLQPAYSPPADAGHLANASETWAEGHSTRPALPTLEHRALWLLHANLRRQPPDHSGSLFPAILAMASLEEARLRLNTQSWPDFLEALRRNRRDRAMQSVGSRLTEFLEPLLGQPELLSIAERALSARLSSNTGEEEVIASATCFGALFLLLPALVEFPAEQIAPDRCQALRFAVFQKCCPAPLRVHVGRDALILDLFGVEPEQELDLDPVVVRDCLKLWLNGLGCIQADSHPDHVTARGYSILIDPVRGHWLSLEASPEPGGNQPDLDYLAPRDTGLDRALCLIARAVLRNFAWRLPGFAQSSLAHLWMNFLDVPARLQTFPDRRVVRIAAPPLHVILGMTGVFGSSFRLPWLDDRPFCLFPEA